MILCKIKELIFRLKNKSQYEFAVGNIYKLGDYPYQCFYRITNTHLLSITYHTGFVNARGIVEFNTKTFTSYRYYIHSLLMSGAINTGLSFEEKTK